MKQRMTRQDVKSSLTLNVGYCKAQWLLTDTDAIGYNAGIYGWNWDAYDVDGVTVVTGYRNFPAGCRKAQHVDKYNAMAGKALENHGYEELARIRNEWIRAEYKQNGGKQ